MTNSLVRNPNGTAQARTAWPFRDLLGFDPFQNLRVGFEYDVTRTDKGYEVEVPVPGFSAAQVEVTFKDGIISINAKGDRRSFSRSFTVPEDIDPEAIGAKVVDGMLSLTLNRIPEAQPKRIQVN